MHKPATVIITQSFCTLRGTFLLPVSVHSSWSAERLCAHGASSLGCTCQGHMLQVKPCYCVNLAGGCISGPLIRSSKSEDIIEDIFWAMLPHARKHLQEIGDDLLSMPLSVK